MVRIITSAFLVFVFQIVFSQQYDSVIIEEDSVDVNNNIYKTGNKYVFDYEIIEDNECLKLKKNFFTDFQFVSAKEDSINVDRIHLVVKSTSNNERTNENQTQISYFEKPINSSISSTGLVENRFNIWIHPIRTGFFRSLETCPFPFVKLPIEIGKEWVDSMVIPANWGHVKWGTWDGGLLQAYKYKVTGREKIKTNFGLIDCYVIESTAASKKGQTTLKSYFSETFGFVRLEFVLLTYIRINMWLVGLEKNKNINERKSFYSLDKYY